MSDDKKRIEAIRNKWSDGYPGLEGVTMDIQILIAYIDALQAKLKLAEEALEHIGYAGTKGGTLFLCRETARTTLAELRKP